MGCSNGKTLEKTKNGNGKFSFPKCSSTFDLESEVFSMVVNDHCHVLLGVENAVQVLDITEKKVSQKFTELTGRVNCMIKLTNGQIVTAGQDKKIQVWDINDCQCKNTFTRHTSMI